MKTSNLIHYIMLLLCSTALLIVSCAKGSKTSTPTPTSTRQTTTDSLVSAPWKIYGVGFYNETTLQLYTAPTPDSLQNTVLTFNRDNTFTEIGGKTASGTWAFSKVTPNTILFTTTTVPVSVITWNYRLTSTELLTSNTTLNVTYHNAADPIQPYIGEELDFIH